MSDMDRNQQVSLGCGTLILIALIVLFFSNRNGDDVKNEIRKLRTEIQRLDHRIRQQSEEVKALRDALDRSSK